MPGRPRTDVYWRERVRAITEESPKLGPKAIERALAKEAARLGRDDAPLERTISRIRAEFRREDLETRRLYRAAHWPESFEDGSLPWECSQLMIEVTRRMGRAPSVRTMRWAWRVTLARPDAPLTDRWQVARYMAFREVVPGRGELLADAVHVWLGGGELQQLRMDWRGLPEPDFTSALEAASGWVDEPAVAQAIAARFSATEEDDDVTQD